MAKYQFFIVSGGDRSEFTYLEMGKESFLREKEQLLNSGFEVDGDVIYADNPEEATKKFKSNFTHVMHEFNNNNLLTSLIQYVVDMFSARRQKKS
ncbi:hypothetical protein [Vibrio sp. HN007]|uniref:hypothetical protein n=1 Tax=Vibrio iocasae TaxID=3098914 RepID=UPI0035D42FFD